MEKLGLDLKILIAQIVNFGILFFILKKVLYKPVIRLIDDRNKKINEALTNSQKIEEELKRIEEDREKTLAKAREEAKEEREVLLKLADKEKEDIINEAREKARKEISKGLQNIKQEQSKAIKALSDKFMDEAVEKLYKKIAATTRRKNFPLLKRTLG